MKTKLLLRNFIIALVTVAGIFVTSCTKEEPLLNSESQNDSKVTLKNGQIDYVECELTAGQTINVGRVVYSHQVIDGKNYMIVEYMTTNGWGLYELHLYVGNLANLPTKKSALQIGHFPYSAENLNGVTYYKFEIALEGVSYDSDGYLIAAHAVVRNGLQEETAWANCTFKPVIMLKSYFTNGNFAITDGIHFSDDWYCWHGGFNFYDNGDEYLLQQKEYYPAESGGAGKVNVSDNGTNITVLVTPNEGLVLDRSYLFVGSMSQFMEISRPIGTCPDFTHFPYQLLTPGPTHTFVVPKPSSVVNNVPFESIDEKMRWGWYSYYKF